MKIFNIKQIDVFLKNGASAIGAGTGNRYKIFVEFKEDKIFQDLMARWLDKKF